MSIQYFYNFCMKDIDDTDLSGDLLSGVRRSFFRFGEKIRDKITSDSDKDALTYDFSIEKEKPMKWTVKSADGVTMQDVMLSDNGKYYIYFYRDQALFKRLLFSKHHTLLKEEYYDTAYGVVRCTLEPRKAQNGLCILCTLKSSPQPIPLFEEPEVADDRIRARMQREFDDYTVIAATNEGIVRFLSEQQKAHFNSYREKCEQELAAIREESFVGDDTPLLDKINAKDFNVKRNLSSALDITQAMAFGDYDGMEEAPPEPAYPADILTADYADEYAPVSAEPASDEPMAAVDISVTESEQTEQPEIVPAAEEPAVVSEPVYEPVTAPEPEPEEPAAPAADKLIMADGAIYKYYGELDAQGNRTGYGRTMTELGRTAYEGRYENDKRSGNGSYFYKNGMLCYTGDWKENVRHGVGVGVSSRDGSIHVGSWKHNKPDGNGVRLSADGNIKFVCKELSDGTTVLMNYMPDDSVIISKYDKNGMKIGDTTVSLKKLL